MPYYKPSSHRKMRKFFKKKKFKLTEGAEHTLAEHESGEIFSIPRHTYITPGVTMEICKRLQELGYEKADIEKML